MSPTPTHPTTAPVTISRARISVDSREAWAPSGSRARQRWAMREPAREETGLTPG